MKFVDEELVKFIHFLHDEEVEMVINLSPFFDIHTLDNTLVKDIARVYYKAKSHKDFAKSKLLYPNLLKRLSVSVAHDIEMTYEEFALYICETQYSISNTNGERQRKSIKDQLRTLPVLKDHIINDIIPPHFENTFRDLFLLKNDVEEEKVILSQTCNRSRYDEVCVCEGTICIEQLIKKNASSWFKRLQT